MRAQAATEYLVILGAVLLLGVIVVNLLNGFSGGGISSGESASYWSTSSPFSIDEYWMLGDTLVLDLGYSGSGPVKITGISIDGSYLDWAVLSRNSSGSLTSTPFCSVGACSLVMTAGKKVQIGSLNGLNGTCSGGAASFYFKEVKIVYDSTQIQGHTFVGIKPLVGPCNGNATLSATPVPTPVSNATLAVFSVPVNASIFLNGTFQGYAYPSNLTIANLLPGYYLVNASMPGYVANWSLVNATSGWSGSLSLSLAPVPIPNATLTIYSVPVNASVYLNGSLYGMTYPSNLTISYLLPGYYLVNVSMSGYTSNTTLVNATSGWSGSVNLSLSPAVMYVNLSSCGTLNTNSSYRLVNNIAVNLSPNNACFSFMADGANLDCNGFGITGNNTINTTAVWTARNASVVKNCNISNFAVAIYSTGSYTTVYNNTISVPINNTPSSDLWQGIYLQSALFGNVSYNTITNILSIGNPSGPIPTYPSGIQLFFANKSIISNNRITATGVYAYGLSAYASSSNNISSNAINTTGTGGFGIRLSFSSSSNNVSSNLVSTSNANGYGISLFTTCQNNTVYSNSVSVAGSTAHGIRLYSSSNWNNISFNAINSTGASANAFYFDTSSNFNNVSFNNASTTGTSAASIYLANSDLSNLFAFNSILTTGQAAYGIYAPAGSNLNNFSRNNITTTYIGASEALGAQAIYVLSGNNTIINNIINTTGGYGYGIWLSGANATWNNVSGNNVTASGANVNGIYLQTSSSFNNVSFNNVTASAASSFGVNIVASGSNTVSYNNVVSSANYGFGASGNLNNLFRNNVTGTGLKIVSANNDTIFGNFVTRGIFLGGNCNNSNVSYNSVPSNYYGLYLQESDIAIPNSNNSFMFNNVSITSGANPGIYAGIGSNNQFMYNIVNSTTAGPLVSLSAGSINTTFYANLFGTTTATVYSATGNTSASFTNDKLICTACVLQVLINQSSSSVFTNVTLNRSLVSIGSDVAFGPNNFTVRWPVMVNLTQAGSPVSGKYVNVSNSTSYMSNAGLVTDAAGFANFTVTQFVNITNSSGNYVLNYTPHNFTAYKAGFVYSNSSRLPILQATTIPLVYVP